jgi:TIR domain
MKDAVYVSHAYEDKSIAQAIYGKLESAHVKCWKATWGTAAFEDWREPGRKAIESSRVIVVVLSENANAAPHLEREIALAISLRRILVPFRLAETTPRPEIRFYLAKVPWLNASNPPADEHLKALTARVIELISGSASAGAAAPFRLQSDGKKAASFSSTHSWFSDLKSSDSRTLRVLKWVSLTTFLCAGVLFVWFALRQTKEWASLAESRRRSMNLASGLSPSPSPQSVGGVPMSKQASAFTRFGLWQGASISPTPLVQGPQEPPLDMPAPSAEATSSPQGAVTPVEQAAELVSEPRSANLPLVTHRVSHEHHPQFPGTQAKEVRKIADLKNQRDSLRSQLKGTEANVLAMQENADRVTSQRDELRTQLSESEEKRQIGQENLEILARELDKVRGQLKESETRVLTLQKSEELMQSQRDALQTRLQETEEEARTAQKNADLATSQRDALQGEIGDLRERAQRAEATASLAASQRDLAVAELRKREEEEAREKKARLNQHAVDLAELPESAADTQFEEARQDAQAARQDAELAQTLPLNPGHNVQPEPFTQTLDSFVKPTGSPGN